MNREDVFTLGVIVVLSIIIGFALITAITTRPEDAATEKLGELIYQLRA